MLYALASRDLYGDKATDDDGIAYFDTYARSLTTMFRLFIGEGDSRNKFVSCTEKV